MYVDLDEFIKARLDIGSRASAKGTESRRIYAAYISHCGLRPAMPYHPNFVRYMKDTFSFGYKRSNILHFYVGLKGVSS